MSKTDLRYTAEEGARIVTEVREHPKRDLIRTIAAATFDLANEDATGSGGGMWWHLSWAYALVEALPALALTERDSDWMCGAYQPVKRNPYRCTEPADHAGAHLAAVDGAIAAQWSRSTESETP